MLTLVQLIKHFKDLGEIGFLYGFIMDISEGTETLKNLEYDLRTEYGIFLTNGQIDRLFKCLQTNKWLAAFNVSL